MRKGKKRHNPNNNEFEKAFPVTEHEPVVRVKKKKGDIFRKAFGKQSKEWQGFITRHLRRAGLKGRTFQDAQKAMIVGARQWRLVRAYGSPIMPIDEVIANGKLRNFEIMKYVGMDDHAYFPHRATMRSGARVIVPDIRLLRRKDVPVITRGKGYLFTVDKTDLMYSPPKPTKLQAKEQERLFEEYLESPGAKAIAKKYGL